MHTREGREATGERGEEGVGTRKRKRLQSGEMLRQKKKKEMLRQC